MYINDRLVHSSCRTIRINLTLIINSKGINVAMSEDARNAQCNKAYEAGKVIAQHVEDHFKDIHPKFLDDGYSMPRFGLIDFDHLCRYDEGPRDHFRFVIDGSLDLVEADLFLIKENFMKLVGELALDVPVVFRWMKIERQIQRSETTVYQDDA